MRSRFVSHLWDAGLNICLRCGLTAEEIENDRDIMLPWLQATGFADPAEAVAFIEEEISRLEAAPPTFICYSDSRELMRLVKIGALRNGREIFIPEPEWEVMLLGCYQDAHVAEDFAPLLFAAILSTFVLDQQRVYDGIMTGRPHPFEHHVLPTFAQIYRMG